MAEFKPDNANNKPEKEKPQKPMKISDLLKEVLGKEGEGDAEERKGLSEKEIQEAYEKEEFKKLILEKPTILAELRQKEKRLEELKEVYRNPALHLKKLIDNRTILVVEDKPVEEIYPGEITEKELEDINELFRKILILEKEIKRKEHEHKMLYRSRLEDTLDPETVTKLQEIAKKMEKSSKETQEQEKEKVKDEIEILHEKLSNAEALLSKVNALLRDRIRFEEKIEKIEEEKRKIQEQREYLDKLEDEAALADKYYHPEVKEQVNKAIREAVERAERKAGMLERMHKTFSHLVNRYATENRLSFAKVFEMVKDDPQELEKLRAFIEEKIKEKGLKYEDFQPGLWKKREKDEKYNPLAHYKATAQKLASEKMLYPLEFAVERREREDVKKILDRIQRNRQMYKIYKLVAGPGGSWVKKVFGKETPKKRGKNAKPRKK